MFEKIRNKYLYNKTQIVELNKDGVVLASDNLIYKIAKNSNIVDFHPFFETILSLIDQDNQEYTFSCIHLDINSEKTSIDVVFSSGSKDVNPILIFFDFTEHYNNFQNIAQEKNESILSFHLAEMKNQQLESEKAFKNKFLANVSHDLRTPLSASLWFVGMLEKSEITPSQKEIILLLKETTNHIKDLVDDILDLSKIELGEIKIHNAIFDFREMINHIEKIITPKTEEKKLFFEINLEKKPPQFLIGDKKRIVQILINLLDNAVKFTKKGGIKLLFTFENLEHENLNLIIKVIDTGSGINTSDKEEVYQSFKKLHNSKKIDGSGLGLSIVFNLIQLMNGKIEFESEINLGTSFTIELPLSIDNSMIDKGSNFKLIKFNSIFNVLIVEDDDINQIILMKILLNHGGFNINIANNGFQALDMIKQHKYDLIFMDKEMPHMDGFKTTTIIRENDDEAINSIPIIGVSGHFVESTLGICDAMGFNGYIVKPFKKDAVYEVIYQVLKIKKP